MKVLVTGADGFVGKNLRVFLQEKGIEAILFTRNQATSVLKSAVTEVDFVFHLAGVNRPKDVTEFAKGNHELTECLCAAIRSAGRAVPVLFTSSIQAEYDNPYGVSKREAEIALESLSADVGSPVYLFRLPNVFGKWSRPNYNSAVATFCHNIARDLPIQINDPSAKIRLVYIDDVIEAFLSLLENKPAGISYPTLAFEYCISVGDLADQLRLFKHSRESMITERVGAGLARALYSTYLSFLEPATFAYSVPEHADSRGRFVEMLKTPDSGQFSFFTAHPGITRGGHYHHTKSEKFLVIQGRARFGFCHVVTGEKHEILVDGELPRIVETVPGWAHDITNIGDNEMIVMLWANEIFDRQRPDTVAHKV